MINLYKQKYIREINLIQEKDKAKNIKNNMIDNDDIICVIDFLNIEKDEY